MTYQWKPILRYVMLSCDYRVLSTHADRRGVDISFTVCVCVCVCVCLFVCTVTDLNRRDTSNTIRQKLFQ